MTIQQHKEHHTLYWYSNTLKHPERKNNDINRNKKYKQQNNCKTKRKELIINYTFTTVWRRHKCLSFFGLFLTKRRELISESISSFKTWKDGGKLGLQS